MGTHALPTGFDSAFAQMMEVQGKSAVSVEQPVLESLMLAQALGQITGIEIPRNVQTVFQDIAFEGSIALRNVPAAPAAEI